MKRPTIKSALISVFILIAVSSAVMGYVAISGLERTNHATADIAENWLPSVEKSQQILAEMAFLRLAYRDHLIFGDEDTLARQEAIITERSEKLRAEIDDYVETSQKRSSSSEERELVANLKTSVNEYISSSSSFMEASRRRDYEAAKQALITARPYAEKVAELVSSLVARNRDGSAQASSSSEAAFERTKIIAFLTLVFVAMVLMFAVVFIIRGVASPISQITLAMRRLADGDITSTIPYAGRADEIGHMAAAVSVFREAAIANRRLEEEAEEARKRAEMDRREAQEKAEADAAERLRVATSGLAVGLTRLAGGDLTCELLEPFSADFEALRHDFNRSVTQLSATLIEVTGAIVTIDGGTREIAAGADDLSKRTEQQAASLEETSAALDQITVNVSNSTKRSEDARVVATNANHSAKLSADVVSQAEQAMTKIEESSQQISNIIGVIDEIAFQTNLLALNAGVEAARAGEAGKGFAVVAQEVRELAQRSANAAKDIKTLIQTSTSEVHSGVKLVRDTADSLKTIGTLIIEMNGHMDAIAISAREQSTGLGEINTAMNQMDQSTQQNAAMVEQSTAAANTLAQEAGRLRDLVGKFKLKGATTSRAETKPIAIVPAVKPVPSPARALGKTVAAAFSGNTALGSRPSDWEEF